MKISKAKVLAVLSVVLIVAVPVAAKWKFRGGAVTDYGRLAKNVADVAQIVKTAQNYIQMVKNMNWKNFGDTLDYLAGDYEHYSNKVEDVINQSKTALNSKVSIKRTSDKPLETVDEVMKKGKLYLQDLNSDSELRIKDSLSLIGANAYENTLSGEDMGKILGKMDLGLLSEAQRNNAISIASGKMMLNQAYQEAADLINGVEADKAVIEKEKIEAARRRANTLPIYDPMENEKEIRSKNYGFPKFGN